MPSTYTDSGRIELMAPGENDDSWGDKLNTNLQLLEAMISGQVTVALTGSDVTLVVANGAADQARAMAIKLTGTLTANVNVIVPDETKLYIIHNATSGAFTATVKTVAGSGVAVAQAKRQFVWCDGTTVAGLDALPIGALLAASNLSDLANAATARTNLGLGTAAVQADTRYAHRANNLSDLADTAVARTNLGLGTAALIDEEDIETTPTGWLWGLNVEWNTGELFTVAAGVARDDGDAATLRRASSLQKTFASTWSAGAAGGAMVTGESLPTAGTVHVWLIGRADGTTDIAANNHASSGLTPTLPTGYVYKRRIGSVRTSSSLAIEFIQNGNHFELVTPVLSIDVNPTTTAALRALTVPLGLKVLANFNLLSSGGGKPGVYLSNPAQADNAPSDTAAPLHVNNVELPAGAATIVSAGHWVRTDTSGQIRTRNASDVSILRIATLGWIDTRGRDD